MMTYRPVLGEHILRTCDNVLNIVRIRKRSVTAEFNGIEFDARPGMTAIELEQRWRRKFDYERLYRRE